MRDYKMNGRRKSTSGSLRDKMWPRRAKPLPKGFQAMKAPKPLRRQGEKQNSEQGHGNGPPGGLLWRLPLARLSAKPLRAAYVLALLWLLGGTLVMLPGLWQRPLAHVTLLGREALSEAEVLSKAGVRPGMTLLGFDPYTAAERLSAHPRIAQADVRRWFPGSVTVRVAERHPVFQVQTLNGTVLLDADHVVLPVPVEGPDTSGLLSIRQVNSPALPGTVLQDDGLARAAAVFEALAALPAVAEPEAVVDASDPLRIVLDLPRRRARLLLPERGLAEALHAYAALAPSLSASRGLRELDLRLLFEDGRVISRILPREDN